MKLEKGEKGMRKKTDLLLDRDGFKNSKKCFKNNNFI